MTSVPIRVVLADDQALIRAGFRLVLERDGDIDVVAEAADGAEAVALVRRHHPDVLLVDVRMPRRDGIEATRDVLTDAGTAGTRVVVLTTFDDGDAIADALRAGASGFLLKDVEPDDLRRCVRVVAGGDAQLSPSVARQVLAELRATPDRRPRAPERLDGLTPREREVVGLVGRGLDNRGIAAALSMSPATAKTHVNRAMAKVGARDRAQLAVVAHETGLVP